ncbi:MAG: hypothetical protein KatS3mg035_2022 [Bacteroidia bacterium]|nr:MAG: hypothetical protein KatS3mg035_2022 [Bacteroidia bacterium]
MQTLTVHQQILEFLETQKEKYLSELFELLRIPSISADTQYKNEVLETAEWLKNHAISLGFDNVQLLPTDGFPVLYGEKIVNPNFPTIIIYGHYDVQPADPIELWQTPPFEPTVRDGKIYARGATDDKGQFFMHFKAFELLQKTTGLPCNVKLMIEGEEEVGSPNLGPCLKKYKDLFQGDVILVSDTSLIANDIPSITTGLRGLAYLEVEVTGPNRDLHSGTYGGAVYNPINVLCQMITKLKNDDGVIQIPHFYDDVLIYSEEERKLMAEQPFNLEEYKKSLGIEEVFGEKGYTTIERTSIRPCLDVNGIWGGYTGEGSKTVLPSKAYAKISMRLVPNQDPDKITQLFTDYFLSIAPKGVKVKVKPHHGGKPVITPLNSGAYKAASRAMEISFGKTPIPTKGGGSIPIVALFNEILHVPTVLMGFGLDSDALHSPNEHYGIFNFFKGIETIALFHHELKKIHG